MRFVSMSTAELVIQIILRFIHRPPAAGSKKAETGVHMNVVVKMETTGYAATKVMSPIVKYLRDFPWKNRRYRQRMDIFVNIKEAKKTGKDIHIVCLSSMTSLSDSTLSDNPWPCWTSAMLSAS